MKLIGGDFYSAVEFVYFTVDQIQLVDVCLLWYRSGVAYQSEPVQYHKTSLPLYKNITSLPLYKNRRTKEDIQKLFGFLKTLLDNTTEKKNYYINQPHFFF